MDYTQDSWDAYVRYIEENFAYDSGFTAIGDSPENFRLEAIPNEWCPEYNFIPTIELAPEVDGEYIYFMPIVKLPPLDSRIMEYGDSIGYCLELAYKDNMLGRFCRELIDNPYSIDRFEPELYEE